MKASQVESNPEQSVTDSLRVFESRWRYAVFPAMVLFVMLIGFMFYLIYGILQRMEDLSRDISNMSGVISEALPVMQGGVVGMSSAMQFVGNDMKAMSHNMDEMSNVIIEVMPKLETRVSEMSGNISDMTVATSSMAMTTHNMGQSMWDMNSNISKPLSVMNKMIPWSSKERTPRPYAPPAYYRNPIQQVPIPAHIGNQAGNINSTQPNLPEATTSAVIVTLPGGNEMIGKDKYQGFCASCHGANAQGGVGPPLKGKSAEYITQVLNEYRKGIRIGTMVGVVQVLTEEDIRNVANYLASGS